MFSDPLARVFVDEYHSADETREIIIGHSGRATGKELYDYQENVKN